MVLRLIRIRRKGWSGIELAWGQGVKIPLSLYLLVYMLSRWQSVVITARSFLPEIKTFYLVDYFLVLQ